MLIYIAHKVSNPEDEARAKRIYRALQQKDLQNTYLCPALALKSLGGIDTSENRLDVLTVCDELVIASEDVGKEIELAVKIGMPMSVLDKKQ